MVELMFLLKLIHIFGIWWGLCFKNM